jgi:hypothetical protein
MRVEIAAAGEVYRNAAGDFLYDSSNVPSDSGINSPNPPRQRFVATGLSVNNTPQTGDPTQYSFDLSGDTEVNIRWRQDFALLVSHDFSATESPERDPQGNPWAGPLVSSASGNPSPDATKIQWITRGEEVIAQIDGQVLDFSRPGLDIRYVPQAYRARGSARGVFLQNETHTNAFSRSASRRPSASRSIPSSWMGGAASNTSGRSSSACGSTWMTARVRAAAGVPADPGRGHVRWRSAAWKAPSGSTRTPRSRWPAPPTRRRTPLAGAGRLAQR